MDEEVRRALYGVKQMKEVMWRNEQKHEHLMKSLQHSSEKKKVRPTLTFLKKDRQREKKFKQTKMSPFLPPGGSPTGQGGD